MKLRTAVTVAFLGLATLACGGGGGASSSDLSAYSVPLTAPWTDMKLPTDGGSVLYSDATTCSVTFQNGKVDDLGAKFADAIKAGGYTESFKSTDNGMWTATYTKDNNNLTLAVMSAMGVTTVSLTTTKT